MFKRKIIDVLLIALLSLSVVVFCAPAWQQSIGGEKTACLSFMVAGQSSPNVTRLNYHQGGNFTATTITAVFQNMENFEVHGTVTGTLRTSQDAAPLVQTSDRITIAANQYATVVFTFPKVPFQQGYAAFVSQFAAEETVPSTVTTNNNGGSGAFNYPTGGSKSAGFDYSSLAIGVSAAVIAILASIGSVVVIKKRGISEQKVKRFTSFEFQDWVLQRLNGHAGSVLDSRRGIDGFTGDNVPISIKQSDNVERLQVDVFMNNLIQAKIRNGLMVAFGFSSEANAAVSRARVNRIDIKLVTVRELIEHKESAII